MEKVQLNLERFIDELRDLNERKLFTQDELGEIVSKRRQFEISLISTSSTPINYLNYIQYERKLDQLRKLRLNHSSSTKSNKKKKTISDHSIAAHINQLYSLSLIRFPTSTLLYDAAIAHAIESSQSAGLVSRTMSKAIAMNPTLVKYWILASKFESEGTASGLGGGNIDGARKLCMRALRFLKGREHSTDEMKLWLEWIRLEVAESEKLRERWNILGIHKVVAPTDEIEIIPEDRIDIPDLPNETPIDDTIINEPALTGPEAIIDGAIIRVVIDSTLSSFSHSLSSHQTLINYIRSLPTPIRLPLLSHIYDSIRFHFPSSSAHYSDALHLLSTVSLYDSPYDPSKKIVVPVQGEESRLTLKGERLVDGLAKAIASYWKVLRKRKCHASVWQKFCSWLEETREELEEQVEEERNDDLITFVNTNLSTALSLAPKSTFTSLIHLRHLLHLSTPPLSLLSFTKAMTSTAALSASSVSAQEELYIARIDVVLAIVADSDEDQDDSEMKDEANATFTAALKLLPFSVPVWSRYAAYIESSLESEQEVLDWYERNIRSVLALTNALPPQDFISHFSSDENDGDEDNGARGLIQVRYLDYLTTRSTATQFDIENRLAGLLQSTSSLTESFLAALLASPSFTAATELRRKVHNRIIKLNPSATAFVRFALELLKKGAVTESNRVLAEGKRVLRAKGMGEDVELEREWMRCCDEI